MLKGFHHDTPLHQVLGSLKVIDQANIRHAVHSLTPPSVSSYKITLDCVMMLVHLLWMWKSEQHCLQQFF